MFYSNLVIKGEKRSCGRVLLSVWKCAVPWLLWWWDGMCWCVAVGQGSVELVHEAGWCLPSSPTGSVVRSVWRVDQGDEHALLFTHCLHCVQIRRVTLTLFQSLSVLLSFFFSFCLFSVLLSLRTLSSCTVVLFLNFGDVGWVVCFCFLSKALCFFSQMFAFYCQALRYRQAHCTLTSPRLLRFKSVFT